MTDRQKLIYDLALQCAAVQVSKEGYRNTSLASAMLQAFEENVTLYASMIPDKLDAALDKIKKV